MVGRVGYAGVSAAWMPRPSPQGWVYGVPCVAPPPGQPSVAKRSPRPPRGASPLAGYPDTP
ncbi:hypothetical protein EGJ77_19520 [Stenotrophomonas maltophilia]|nr:hypothetical protein EGJ77_19520 [Stenotrophomonas maltophilia]